jgi:hypothetical protein
MMGVSLGSTETVILLPKDDAPESHHDPDGSSTDWFIVLDWRAKLLSRIQRPTENNLQSIALVGNR